MDFIYIIGQILGIVAVFLGFLSYQMNTSKKIMLVLTMTCGVFSVHYFLIGATSAFVLNVICTIRNIVYYHNDKKIFSGTWIPVVFAVLMVLCGFQSWQGLHSLFVIVGLAINTLCMAFKDSRNIKKSILVTSPLVIVYNVFARSIGGVIFETVVIISSIIGLIRQSKANHTAKGLNI